MIESPKSADTPDLSKIQPKFRVDLKMSVARRDGDLVHLLEDPISGKVYQVGVQESAFFLAMDGSRSIADFLQDENCALDESQLLQLHQWAHAKSLWLDHSEAAVTRDKAGFQRQNRIRFTKWLNPISIQVSLGCPERLIERLTPYLSWLFQGWVTLAWIVLAIVALSQLYENGTEFASSTGQSLANGGWIVMLVTWLVAKVVHETSHAVACRRFGVRVSDCGIIFILLMPLAYVDVSSCNRLASRWQRIVISAAGVYVELMLTFAAIIAWCTVKDESIRSWLQAWVVTSGVTTVLFNANPLMRYDGYYILSDWLDITNLSTRGKNEFWNSVSGLTLGVQNPPSEFFGWRKRLIWSYGLLSGIWRVLLTFTLIMAASAMFHGAGILIAIVAALSSLGSPVLQLIQTLRAKKYTTWKFRNVIATSALTVLFSISIFNFLNGPVWLSAPGVVQLAKESKVRSEASGFVKEVLVKTGQRVEAGQGLVILENKELEFAVAELEIQIAQANVRARLNREQKNFAEYEADQREIAGLEKQLSEKKIECDNRRVTANCAGTVIETGVEKLLGTFIKRGDVLLTLDSNDKEICVSISQDDLPSLRQNMDGQIEVMLTGFPKTNGRIKTLIPNASLSVPSDALAKINGGPLSVREGQYEHNRRFQNGDSGQNIELLEPRFVANVKLESNHFELPAGQTGTVYFRSLKRSLGTYWYLAIRQWFRSHLPRIT